MLDKEKKALLTKITFSVLFFAIMFYVHPVRAAIGPLLDDALIKKAQCGPNSDCSLNTFIILGVRLSDIILGVVGSLTLLMFVYGGVMLLLSGGNSETVARGKSIILGSVVGLCIVFGSYTIIKFTVNNILGAKQGYQFTGGAPGSTTNQGGDTTNKCVEDRPGRTASCINKNQACEDPYGSPGYVAGTLDCTQNKVCCITDDIPSNQTCTGSDVSNTCILPPQTCAGTILSLPCANRGICCNIPS